MKAVVFAFLFAGLSGVLGFVLPTGAGKDELAKLASAEKAWKKLSAGSNGYLVRNHASGLAKTLPALLHSAHSAEEKFPKGGDALPRPSDLEKFPNIVDDLSKDDSDAQPSFVDKTSGAVHKVCDGAVMTVPPTKPPRMPLPVQVIHRVEEMFARLKLIVKMQFCKVVKIVYSEDEAYPVLARLAGCKSPVVDSILDLGHVILTPKSHASKKGALCKFAKAHSKELDAASKKALTAFLPYIRVGTVMPIKIKAVDPKPVTKKPHHVNPEHLKKALKDVKSAIKKIAPTQTPRQSLKSLQVTMKDVANSHFTSQSSSLAVFHMLPAVLEHLATHPMPKVWPVKAIEPRSRPAGHQKKQSKVTPELVKKAVDDVKDIIKRISQPQKPSASLKKLHGVIQKAVTRHFQPESHVEAMAALNAATLQFLTAHPMTLNGMEREGMEPVDMPEPVLIDEIPARLPDETGFGNGLDMDMDEDDDEDRSDAARGDGHHHRHHRHHGRHHKVKMILFYTSAGVLGMAILFTLYRSVRECRKSRPVPVPAKAPIDGSINYGKLVEEVDDTDDLPPMYNQAHGVASPTDV